MRNRSGNPSTPGPGLRTLVRAEQARKAAEQRQAVKAANKSIVSAMAKGVK